jgi:NADH-quinone oxidoreductase subunit N
MSRNLYILAATLLLFALIYRFFAGIDILSHVTLEWVLTSIAILSMLGGNWLALRQTNVKRMLAYSSTAHLGYLMLPFLVGGRSGVAAAAFYLLAYSATSLGLFGTMSVLSDSTSDAEATEDYRGLAWRRPGLAAVMTTMLLSIAGIPLTIGFMGKIYLLTTGVGSSLWVLAIVLVASSGIGLFYYLRLVAVQFATRADYATRTLAGVGSTAVAAIDRRIGAVSGFVLVVLTAAVIFFGIYPTPLLNLISAIVPSI